MFIVYGSRKLDNVTLLLTKGEAEELHHSISDLLSNNEHHAHVSSDDYQTEVSISILEKNNLESYHPDICKIINDDVL